MTIQNQVSNLELSRKLEKLGVKQDGYWMWVKYSLWKEPKLWASDLTSKMKVTCFSGKLEYAISAFTVAELGEMMPITIEEKDKMYFFEIRKCEAGWLVGYVTRIRENFLKYFRDKKLVDEMAKMKIYLLKEGY